MPLLSCVDRLTGFFINQLCARISGIGLGWRGKSRCALDVQDVLGLPTIFLRDTADRAASDGVAVLLDDHMLTCAGNLTHHHGSD